MAACSSSSLATRIPKVRTHTYCIVSRLTLKLCLGQRTWTGRQRYAHQMPLNLPEDNAHPGGICYVGLPVLRQKLHDRLRSADAEGRSV
jgi:hypothetical protein